MHIKQQHDDVRLAALNRPLDQTVETRPAEELLPVTRPKPVAERGEQQYQSRRKEDRRKGEDRRRENRTVLLDTRSKRERRKGPRRSEERDSDDRRQNPLPTSGIDLEC